MLNHEIYMNRCLQLAKNGLGSVSPNPMVGCVIVCDDKIIGEGYHQKYGEAHAEVNAINAVEDKSLLSKCTLYVNLEPCAHHGKTPPCADLIIEHNIPKVVIGCVDANEKVKGKGAQKLIEANVDVTIGVLEKECIELNKRFFTFHNKKRPYIILKWAQSNDGCMDKIRDSSEAKINWITQPETQSLTHLWRSQEDAVLVGKNTVLNDNPELTVRAINGNNPIKIVLGQQESFNLDLNIFKGTHPPIFLDLKSAKEICYALYEKEIQSVMVEGGKKTLELFINENLWDEARILTGDVTLKDGLKAPKINGVLENREALGKDTLEIYINA
ncbi:MAG: bifunctional diaminohydroxyphosphoribosylaminopyrimidine deaminase/5-amino-6-(5-phosphoribosylamino)uracil reductase RibD [Bacteroidia bacterium]